MTLQLTPDQIAFLLSPVSMNIGAVGRDGWPCVCRAHGCVAARDRRSLTVWLSALRGKNVLDALDAGSAITLVVSRPATHATLQLKAGSATRVTVSAAHKLASARCVAAFGAELDALNYGTEMSPLVTAALPADPLVGLRLAPEVVFDQTPGPQSGKVLAGTLLTRP
ncbi:MAG: hypothetical protein A2580_05765 [Hydrogenophilales bacterium RIFOXYD1_FULL_62_11]|nr:MAG: hypothetical protein A2580_05765 [Hydrogenophilales bacterium RIFOXYD1_FULL_62_11]